MHEVALPDPAAGIKLSGSLPELASEEVLEEGVLASSFEVPELSEALLLLSEAAVIAVFSRAAARSAAATAASSCKSTSPHVRSSSM